MGWLQFLVSYTTLTLGILFFWFFNIYLTEKNIRTGTRYIISYLSTFLLHSGTVFIATVSEGQINPGSLIIYSVVGTLAVNTIILIIIHSDLLKHKKDLAELEIGKLKVVNLEAQKKVLLQQLQPHFLFNAMSTLKSLISENPQTAADYTVKLSEFLRYSVQYQNHELVSLKEELQFTSDYIELQQVRFGNALHVQISIPQAALAMKLPVFALQSMVENAIKHNGFTEKKPLTIDITFEHTSLRIANNKSPRAVGKTSGTGLKNLSERYQIISGKTPEIAETHTGFIVFLPLLEP
ncbi:histidine kinase [Rhodocytophaga aerolata]|uniref:Histidine kinase n=1 Tax=Rhodocytophaga aerolata TaxID=455078 RepID=A0ABT8RB91_9BACT|nr:histidine kinase [Rhodocytophaga aerolata]MDO1449369.1 histidine kinase [Rhodocytophaga aerolata]